MFDQLIFK